MITSELSVLYFEENGFPSTPPFHGNGSVYCVVLDFLVRSWIKKFYEPHFDKLLIMKQENMYIIFPMKSEGNERNESRKTERQTERMRESKGIETSLILLNW